MGIKVREKKLARGFSIYLDIYFEGKRWTETLFKILPGDDRKEKLRLAETIRRKKELEIYSEQFDLRKNRRNISSLYEFLDAYLANYDKKDINTMRASILYFKKFHKDIFLTEITPDLIENFYYFLEKTGLRGDTPRSYYRRFRKALNYGVKTRQLDGSVLAVARVKPRNLESNSTLKKEVLTEEEIMTLFLKPCRINEVKKAFRFSCYTGLGYAEVSDLQHSHISNGRLRVYRKKTGTEINLKLSSTALNLIKYKCHDLYVFGLINKHTKKPFSETNVNKIIQKWVKDAGINKKITYYCARHTFAVRLLKKGTDIKVVSDALGHKSLNNTYKYLNHVTHLKDNATSKL